MFALGLREYIAIALLVVAAVIAIAFLTYNDANNGAGGGLEPTPTLAPASPTAGGGRGGQGARTSPTPLLRDTLQAPANWTITLFRLRGDSQVKDAPIARTGLNQEFALVPFPDYQDGQWGIIAESTSRVTPSIFTFEFETSARVIVSAGDSKIVEDDRPGLRKVRVEVNQTSREMNIRIEAFDRAGEPFVLRWQ